MHRLIGCALLFVSSLLLRWHLLARAHLRRKTLRALSEGFLLLAGSVRLTLTPLPRLLQKITCAMEAERFFRACAKQLACGKTLERAWREEAEKLPLSGREREMVASLGSALGGDEQTVCASLTQAAKVLSECEQRLTLQSREESRVTTALCLSGALLAGILLL